MEQYDASNQEVEAKYSIDDADIFSSLSSQADIVPGFRARPSIVETDLDTYYDTKEHNLLVALLALRVRTTVSSSLVTLKSIQSVDHEGGANSVVQRLELECPVDPTKGAPPYMKQLLPEMRKLIAESVADEAALMPVLSLYQERVKRIIFVKHELSDLDTDTELAEMSLDNVWVLNRPEVDSVTAVEKEASAHHFIALEIELLADEHRADFDRLIKAIASWEHVIPETESKFQVGLRVLGI